MFTKLVNGFQSGEIPLTLHRFGKDELIYINLTTEALKNKNNLINGMITVAADVTEQVNARVTEVLN